jgi:hypothetical protein
VSGRRLLGHHVLHVSEALPGVRRRNHVLSPRSFTLRKVTDLARR